MILRVQSASNNGFVPNSSVQNRKLNVIGNSIDNRGLKADMVSFKANPTRYCSDVIEYSRAVLNPKLGLGLDYLEYKMPFVMKTLLGIQEATADFKSQNKSINEKDLVELLQKNRVLKNIIRSYEPISSEVGQGTHVEGIIDGLRGRTNFDISSNLDKIIVYSEHDSAIFLKTENPMRFSARCGDCSSVGFYQGATLEFDGLSNEKFNHILIDDYSKNYQEFFRRNPELHNRFATLGFDDVVNKVRWGNHKNSGGYDVSILDEDLVAISKILPEPQQSRGTKPIWGSLIINNKNNFVSFRLGEKVAAG